MNRTSGAYTRTIYFNWGVVISISGEGCYHSVESAPSSREALARAFRGLSKGGKVLFCKREQDMTNAEKGEWDMPSYHHERGKVNYSVLDMY